MTDATVPENNIPTPPETVPEVRYYRQPRGFALIPPEKHKEISSRGGKAVWAKGTANRWTPEEAKANASKGGKASQQKRRN